jgi:hypothetical protein
MYVEMSRLAGQVPDDRNAGYSPKLIMQQLKGATRAFQPMFAALAARHFRLNCCLKVTGAREAT